jgi:anti-sigma B factor antagonist
LNERRGGNHSSISRPGSPIDVVSEDALSARELEALRGPAVLQIFRRGDWIVVALCGEIDLYNVDSIRELLEDQLVGQAEIVLDLRQVKALDPTALRVLLAAQQRLGWRQLVAVAPSQAVHDVLQSSELDRVVPVYESLGSIRPVFAVGG